MFQFEKYQCFIFNCNAAFPLAYIHIIKNVTRQNNRLESNEGKEAWMFIPDSSGIKNHFLFLSFLG